MGRVTGGPPGSEGLSDVQLRSAGQAGSGGITEQQNQLQDQRQSVMRWGDRFRDAFLFTTLGLVSNVSAEADPLYLALIVLSAE